ncbi:MAG TPA: DUF1493 family protein [Flavisolibacter sp.]|jgi:hypothetical protein|nr:DUF1493 family protein [Flavisolibacter sp.]
MYRLEDIIDLVEEKTGSEPVEEGTDIYSELGCGGDDFHELMERYAVKFGVDMSTYRWYFHTDEEGSLFSIGGAFFKPPYERVRRIPITPKLLLEAANLGRWNLQYPEHTLPKRRWDMLINQVVFITILGCLLYACLT